MNPQELFFPEIECPARGQVGKGNINFCRVKISTPFRNKIREKVGEVVDLKSICSARFVERRYQ
jgi:hypothetical protein